jgi:hypothetical protein
MSGTWGLSKYKYFSLEAKQIIFYIRRKPNSSGELFSYPKIIQIMKNIALSFFLVIITQIGMAQNIQFETFEINYGDITKGANGIREFKFTNVGSVPLIIQDAKGSCGCTVPTYPKEPIMPGASSVIKVKYDTQRVGPFTKYITLTTNDVNNSSVKLSIKGNILPSYTD